MYTGFYSYGVVYPPQCISAHPVASAQDLLHQFTLPPVILWNPLVTSHGLVIQCSVCDQVMYQSSWNDGSLQYNSPRILHDLKSNALLVSSMYKCANGHKTVAHDERVLNKLSYTSIPFILLHKSGFTKDFVNFCFTFCQGGMNFHSLEKAIAQIRWQFYEDRRQLYTEYGNQHEIEQFQILPFAEGGKQYLPSDDTLCQCFVTLFLKNEHLYRSYLQSMPVGEYLSADHTYKIAFNVGYLRNDHKWVSRYDSAFIVFNKKGKIVSWQYTKSGSFDQVKLLLEALENHSRVQGTDIKAIYIDNCCQWRNKVQEIFGSQCKVKLDINFFMQCREWF